MSPKKEYHKTHAHSKYLELFEPIYAQYSGRIYNFIMKLSHGNDYIAEEITQIVFLKLWERIDSIHDKGTLKNYLISMAYTTLLNYLKHDTTEYIYLNYLKGESTLDYTTQDEIDTTFLNTYLSTLISELPPMRQRVFIMSRMECMPNKQIAQSLGISLSTVETHLSLALKFLRQELKRRYNIIGNFPGDKP